MLILLLLASHGEHQKMFSYTSSLLSPGTLFTDFPFTRSFNSRYSRYCPMKNCLNGSTAHLLKAYCIPIVDPSFGFGSGSLLVFPRTRTSMTQSISFAPDCPSNWNKLPQSLRNRFPKLY